MAKKPEPIVRLAAQTARQIFANSGNYMAFLTTAAHNFKYSFRDQLLIYAQKPDATACAQTDFWNKHGRWVNKGTTGIALLVDTDKGYKLRHVFDMSDTNSRAGRTVPVWQMRPQYEGPVVEALENSYGEFSNKADFAACLLETAKIIVEDNFGDYYADLCRVKEGSLLEELDDLNTEVWFKSLLENSVAYIMLTRCGIDPQEYFSGEDFARIYDFNTLKTLAILGAAASDIAEMPLREIASTVLPLYWEEEKQNRTFAGNPDRQYNDGRTKRERSVEHGADIQNRGRLSTAQPGRAGGPAGRKIWDAAAQFPRQSPARDLHRDAVDRGVEQPSGGNRPAGHRDGGAADGANGAGTGRDRGTESVRSDEVGRSDEQHQGSGGGSGAGGDRVRQLTDPLPTEEEQKAAIQAAEDEQSSAFAISQEDIDAVLIRYGTEGKFSIYEQFLKKEGDDENTAFLKKEYGIGGFSVYGSKKLDIWHEGKGIKITAAPEVVTVLTWKKAAKRIGELLAADRYLSPAEKAKYPEYRRQEDTRIARSKISGEFYSIIRDYKDYVAQLGAQDKTVDRWYLSSCADAFSAGEKKMSARTSEGDFILPMMREAMQTIIGENTHLTERCEAVLAQLSGPLAAPLEPTYDEMNPSPAPPKEYRLTMGATVYLGMQEYELLAFDDQIVRLFDPAFPIINKELPREEFDRLLAENPLNDGLLQEVENVSPAEPAEPDTPGYELGFGHLGNGVTVWNRLELRDGDYKTVAHIAPDRTVTYYEDGLPENVRAQIEEFAATSTMTISATQDAPVFSTPPLVREPASGRFWDAYNSIKEHNPDSLVLYQVGDFFELYGGLEGEDAWNAATALDLTLTKRNIPEYGRVSMCGFPAHKLKDYVKELNSKGFDVVVAALKDNQRVISAFPAQPSETAKQETDDFSDIDPAAIRAALAENGIVDGHVVDPEKLDANPFIQKVMADVEQIAANTPQAPERFSVIETDNGYAVWDDVQGGIYVDSEGVQEEFTSEWQAEDYLKQVRKAVADKEAAEWLAVERAKQGMPEPAEKASDTTPAEPNSYRLLDRLRSDCEYYLGAGQFSEKHLWAGSVEAQISKMRELYAALPEKPEWLTEQDIDRYETQMNHKPAEKENAAGAAGKGTEGLANGHGHDGGEPVQAPPAPRRRAKVSPFVLHPEVPNADRHEYHITDDAIGAGTPGTRFNNNVRAIRLLKKLESENRFATPEEQAVLAQYVGWGGLADCFDERHSKYAELKALLDEDEYAAARESTLTAFYTPPVVIRSIYQALENMGFKTGNLLEPSCGIGNFIGMRPESLADSKIYGIELDGISGRIAQQLYQKSSIAVQGFEKTDLPDSFFDAAIGNVPFGSFKVSDKRYDKHNFLIHDYFFARTLDKVRPGGIIAFVTSKGTMDKETPTVRKYIAQRADLLGAIRLPNNTFKDAAGTEVTSDILFLQKREALFSGEPEWVHLNTDENGLKMNQYFIDHPEMVIGDMREVSGPYGPETACLPREGQDLGEQLTAAIQNIQGSITEYVIDDPEAEGEDKSIPADPEVRNFSYTVVDGQVYYRENSRMNPVEVSVTAANRIKGLIGIRDCVRTLIEYQTEDWPAEDIKVEQQKLNALYDAFAAKYGRINSRANSAAFSMDSAYFLLCSLEVLDDERNFVRKADMFTKRTIKQKVAVTSVDTASEALAVSLAEKAKVDMTFMMELTGKTEQEIYADLTGVIFLNPMHGYGNSTEEKYLTADEYLSGNVREKLEWARRSAELYPEDYAANVEALERVQPTDLTASEISVRLGATWLPPDVVEKFIFDLLDTSVYGRGKIHVHYSQYTGGWNVEGKSADRVNVKASSTYGTTRINAYKIIEETLNLRDVRIFDYVEDGDGKKKPVLNKKETAIAQGKQELIKQAFQDWIWKDPQRRERLTRFYNDKFNNLRPREYDGSHINFVGMNPEITLRPHQLNAIAHILYGGNTLLGHVVGAGKTWEMVAAAQESKRLGLCQKSLFVVPNHLTEQWAAEYLQLYPSANILVATKKDFETKNRKRFCGRIATGDYDAIIIGHSQFEKIPMSVERQRYILEQQMDEVIHGLSELKAQNGERFSIKQLERTKKSIKEKLDKLNDQSRKDDVVTFEELGVDRIFIDEAHYYKNLAAFSKMRNVGGISQTEAQKSSDLYMKCRYLDELTGGRGVVFATGTPISNTMVELYTMQKYLQYETLRRNGLLHFDAWASTFGETVTAIELAPEGTGYRAKTRFAKFHNLPELMAMFKEVADIQTADMLKLPVPKAIYHNISLKPSELQKEMVAGLAERAEKVRNKEVDSTVDNMLLITNDGRKLALDQRLLNPMLPDSDTSKINACAENVFEIWQNTADQRSTQMVFCDLSTPGKGRPIEMAQNEQGTFEMTVFQNVYDDLRDKLIAKGIPAEEIAYIHDANTEAKKKELFGKVRSGQIRVLLGSTQKMGAGTNVQKKLIALHHLDCPWRPSDLQQREGRIIRQGNENPEVDIYSYVTEGTFDAYLYQLVESKQKFISQIMTSKSPARSVEDIDETALSYAEIKALCTGNPHIKEKMDLDIDVQRLKLLKANHLSQKYSLEDNIVKYFPQAIAIAKGRIKNAQEDIAVRDANTHPNQDGFSPMVVAGVTYTEKKAAGTAILEVCKTLTDSACVPLGQYRGFEMTLSFEPLFKQYKVGLTGAHDHRVTLGTDIFGNIQRLDNLLNDFESDLTSAQNDLATYEAQLASAKIEVEKPFPQEDELKTKSARLDELNILLNMDKRESEIVDGDVGDESDAPARDGPDRER